MFKPSSLPSLAGKTFLVTGGNTGIGYATVKHLAAAGAHVYMGCRSAQKGSAAVAEIKDLHPKARIDVLLMDLTSLASVTEAASLFLSKETSLHGLILNAGIMAVPYEITKDGFEIQMQVNYLSHWLLTQRLLPTLLFTARANGPGSVRIVCVSSEGHRTFGTKRILYDPAEVAAFGNFGRYGLSKLANVLHAKTLNDQYGPLSSSAKSGNGEIWSASLHPGFIDSQLNVKNKENASWMLKWIHPTLRLIGMMKPWDHGCVASLFAGASPDFRPELSGSYLFEDAQEKVPNPIALEPEERTRLEKWTVEQMKAGNWI